MTTKTTSTNGSGGGNGGGKTHKKQVRRRLHTSRPYQERLLNMAEARREIVTALKHHRASMKQASKIPPPPPENLFSPPLPPPLPDPFSWTNPSLNLLLPNQPLGLNLNFQDFIQTSSSTSSSSSSSSSTSSSSSSSIIPTNPHVYSPPTFTTTTSESAPTNLEKFRKSGISGPNLGVLANTYESDNNMVMTSAWWSELMKTVEPEVQEPDDVFPKITDVMEFPSWLENQTDEELFHPYNLNDHYSSSSQNPPLSCMEIGEIEGIDGDDWFA